MLKRLWLAIFGPHLKVDRASLCPKCGNYDVWGNPGERVCCSCGAHERVSQ